jgi:hypothetical protein
VLVFDGTQLRRDACSSIATTFEAGRTVVRVAGRLAQALLSATSRAGPRPVVEGLMGLGLTHSSPLARPASPGTERRVGKGRVAGGSVHAAEDGVRVERGGRAVDWRAWRAEPSNKVNVRVG